MNFRKLLMYSCAVGAAVTAGGPAFAQAGASSAGIGDIVVTAQKRAENVQDTPIAITAVSQDTLNRQGVIQFNDLTRVAPEVSIGNVGGGLQMLGVRGLRSGQFGPTVDAPNAIHLDGNYIARFQGLNGYFFDLERVEVLAGPQGTLYGRNSVGGALNFITHKPEMGKYGGNISADIGNYNSLILQAAVNLPITDDLAIRVAGMRNRHDGYFTDTGIADLDVEAYRVSARYTPTARDTFTLTGDWNHQGGKGPGSAGNTAFTGQSAVTVLKQPTLAIVTKANTQNTIGIGNASLVTGLSPFPCPVQTPNANPISGSSGGTCSLVQVNINGSDDPWHNAVATSADYGRQDFSGDGFNFQWDHDLDFATLTAQGSWRTVDALATAGQIAGPNQDPRLLAAGVMTTGPNIGTNSQAASEWNSQEIRLTSNDASQTTLQYVAGVTHFYEKAHDNIGPGYNIAAWYSNNSVSSPGTAIGALTAYPSIRTGGGSANNLHTDSFAVFGEATYTPPSWNALHVTLGGRYNWEDKHGISVNLIRAAPGAPNFYGEPVCQYGLPGTTLANITLPGQACSAVGVPYTKFDETRDFERATYKGSLAYDLTDENLVYATYSTGYVSGGYAFGPPTNGDIKSADHSYNPMSVESVEVGSKNRFFDNRLQVNASIYHYDFVGYLTQQMINVPDPYQLGSKRTALSAAVNAGDTEFQGGTFDVTALLTENDRFHLAGQYTEAEIKFNVSNVHFQTIQAYLASIGVESTKACTLVAMTGSTDGSRNGTALTSAAACPLLYAYVNSQPGISGNPGPVYAGSQWPNDFDAGGSFERPKWTLNADYTHTFALPNATLDAQVAWHYLSRQASGPNGIINPPTNLNPVVPAGYTNLLDINSRIPEKDSWDLSFRYQREDAGWSITTYVRNVLDDNNIAGRGLITGLPPGTAASVNLSDYTYADSSGNIKGALPYAAIQELYDSPRTFGIIFDAKF